MGVEREVFGLEEFGSLGVGCIFKQDRAKDGLFRVDVGGQAGFEGEVGDGGHRKECRTKSSIRKAVRILRVTGKLGNQTGLRGSAKNCRRFRVAARLVAAAEGSACFSRGRVEPRKNGVEIA